MNDRIRARSKRLATWGLIAVVGALGAPAWVEADTPSDENIFIRFAKADFYLGAGGALGVSTFDDDDIDDLGVGGGPTLRVGGRPHTAFAWEVEGDWFFKFDEANARPLLVTANARWMLPFTFGPSGQMQPFLLGGSGWMRAYAFQNGKRDPLDSGVFRVGAGLEIYQGLDTSWRIDAQYLLPVGDANEFRFAALLFTLQLY